MAVLRSLPGGRDDSGGKVEATKQERAKRRGKVEVTEKRPYPTNGHIQPLLEIVPQSSPTAYLNVGRSSIPGEPWLHELPGEGMQI